MKNLEKRVAAAVAHFWKTRDQQAKTQGSAARDRDRGARGAVTGGAQMDGFIGLLADLLGDAGIPDAIIYRKQGIELPGFFRATKQWDLLVVADGQLLASIELKSQVGPSFGNNYNNRSEEAVGNATDFWTAYRDGAFNKSPRPWLGYLMLLENTKRSTSPVRVEEPHFKVFEEFSVASYSDRYRLLCKKLVRERLYDAACFLLSSRNGGAKGRYAEPDRELSFANLAASLTEKAMAHRRTRGRKP
ncbi:MAG TPA: PaeR7I family type II restriction endonuclease [Propionibacteriaceae bacterium]|nr:PaeR7I family type II restriction endonuclease [Propionibacteriaceae bacterium]